jgi:hypothetical protein
MPMRRRAAAYIGASYVGFAILLVLIFFSKMPRDVFLFLFPLWLGFSLFMEYLGLKCPHCHRSVIQMPRLRLSDLEEIGETCIWCRKPFDA